MQGKLSNSQIKPYALGITPQSSVYGATIPVIFGRAKGVPYLIWAQDLRQGAGTSKALKSKKNSPPTYTECVDMLLGHNPIAGVLQFWENNNQKHDLNFVSHAFTIHDGVEGTLTIPDSKFYFLLGVTVTLPYNVTFNDYGGQGSSHLTGTYERPLWNSAYAGPDRVNVGGWRWYPYVFRWVPWSGNILDIDVNAKGQLLGPLGLGSATLTAYYAQIPAANHIPLSDLRLTFESELGNGPEYTSTDDFSAQQILYPQFAGFGSGNIDLGTTQALPNIVAEIMGAFSVYSTGDADFTDMMEDILRGVGQAAFTQNPQIQSYSNINHGLQCYEFPGMIQKKLRTSAAAFTNVLFDLSVTAGQVMVVVARNDSGSVLSVTDTMGTSWARTLSGGPHAGFEVWVGGAPQSGANTVTVTPGGINCDIQLMEMGGLDTVGSDFGTINSTYQSGTNGPITGTISFSADSLPFPGSPAYILAVVIAETGAANIQPADPPIHWSNLMVGQGKTFSMYRIVEADNQVYTFTVQPNFIGRWHLLLLPFTNSQPVSYPKPKGEIIDATSMNLLLAQCRANGLFGSYVMDSQRKGLDWLNELASAADAAPVWVGFSLQCIPRSEVSTVGNGAIYVAPSAAGPIVNLSIADFQGTKDKPYIEIARKGPVDRNNIISIQHPNRDSDYNDVTETDRDQGAISLYGPRKASPNILRCVQDVAIGRKLLGIDVRRNQYISPITYKGVLKAKWDLLTPMDLVTLPSDDQSGIVGPLPVRIVSIQESETFDLEVEFEPWLYGAHAPQPVPVGVPDPYLADTTRVPSLINAPVLFEPIGQLADFPNINEIWALISDSDEAYGGSDVYVSTDGGVSYNLIDTIFGNAVTGTLIAEWPQAADPDMVNDLQVDLTESLGELTSRTAADKDNFVYPCYVEALIHWTDLASVAGSKVLTSARGGFSPAMVGNTMVITSGTHFTPDTYLIASFTDAHTIGLAVDPTTGGNGSAGTGDGSGLIPYEIMSYGTVSLIAAHQYDMHASMGGVVWLRRGVAGCPLPQQGVDHPAGVRFAFLDPSMKGWGVISIDPTWINKQLFFKFVQFNLFGGGKDELQNVTAYAFTPLGLTKGVDINANSTNYAVSPESPVYQADELLFSHVNILASLVQFPTKTAKYLARTNLSALVVNPGNYGKRHFVYIYDPNYSGDFNATWSDLATPGAGSLHLTSAIGGFNAGMENFNIQIASGTNFAAGTYSVVQFLSANEVILGSSPTPAGAGSSGHGGLLLNVVFDIETPTHLGLPGYVYMGSLYPDNTGDLTLATVLPGGFPIPGNISMNGKLVG